MPQTYVLFDNLVKLLRCNKIPHAVYFLSLGKISSSISYSVVHEKISIISHWFDNTLHSTFQWMLARLKTI